jgi:DNA-binding transcriptional LysR family regulator
VSENHPLADREEIALSDLAAEDWAMPATDDSGLHGSFRLACENAGFAVRFTHWTLDSAAALALVAKGHTVCGLYPTSFPIPGTVMRPLAGTPHHRRLFLAWRTDSPIASLVPQATEKVLEGYQELMHARPHYDAWWQRYSGSFPEREEA